MIERKENIILQWPQMLSSRLIFLFASMDHILVSVDSIDRLLSFCCFWFKHSHNLSMFNNTICINAILIFQPLVNIARHCIAFNTDQKAENDQKQKKKKK